MEQGGADDDERRVSNRQRFAFIPMRCATAVAAAGYPRPIFLQPYKQYRDRPDNVTRLVGGGNRFQLSTRNVIDR